jgi:hypothetical protein
MVQIYLPQRFTGYKSANSPYVPQSPPGGGGENPLLLKVEAYDIGGGSIGVVGYELATTSGFVGVDVGA